MWLEMSDATTPRMVDSGPKLYSNITNLSRQELPWLTRLRTGHCSLNRYLHRFNIVEQPQCTCGNGAETVSHYYEVQTTTNGGRGYGRREEWTACMWRNCWVIPNS